MAFSSSVSLAADDDEAASELSVWPFWPFRSSGTISSASSNSRPKPGRLMTADRSAQHAARLGDLPKVHVRMGLPVADDLNRVDAAHDGHQIRLGGYLRSSSGPCQTPAIVGTTAR